MKNKTNEVKANERVAMACRGRVERESLNMVSSKKVWVEFGVREVESWRRRKDGLERRVRAESR